VAHLPYLDLTIDTAGIAIVEGERKPISPKMWPVKEWLMPIACRHYAPIFGSSSTESSTGNATTLSDIIVKSMPPMRNLVKEAHDRLDILGKSIKDAVVVKGPIPRLSLVDIYLLDYECLVQLLKHENDDESSERRKEQPTPKSMVAALQRAQRLVEKRADAVPIPPNDDAKPPTLSPLMSLDEQLMAIVRSLFARKAQLLAVLKATMGISHDGPFLKDSYFWHAVRETIVSSSSSGGGGVREELVGMAEGGGGVKMLMDRYRRCIARMPPACE
jgi:hypothetical protein